MQKLILLSKRLLPVAVLLFLWETVSLCLGPDGNLPGPWKTLLSVLGIVGNLSFLKTVGFTLLRATACFILSILAGGVLGIVSGLNESFRSFMKPVIVVVRSTPIVVFLLLFIVWFSADVVPVLVGLLMMLPIVYLNVCEGIRNVDPEIVGMARFYGVSRWKMLREVYVPSIRPFALSGVSNAVGLGWRAVVAAEVLSCPEWGIGRSMQAAQIVQQVEVLMAWALVTVLFGAVFEKILDYGSRS